MKRIFRMADHRSTRDIIHFQTDAWQDHASFSSESLIFLLKFLEKNCARDEELYPFLTVHCSAGIGRSGTFIVAYVLRQLLMSAYYNSGAPPYIDSSQNIILDLILALRKQRPGMVQTWSQFVSLYHFAQHLIDNYTSSYPQ